MRIRIRKLNLRRAREFGTDLFHACVKRPSNARVSVCCRPSVRRYVGGAFQHFFRQLAADPSRDPRGKGYDDPCVAGLVLALPLMLLAARSSYRDETRRAQRNAIIRQHLFLTHASELLVGLAIDVADLIVELLHRHEETDGHGRMKTEQAAAILRKALARMIAANVDSVRDGNASCGLPTRNNRKKEPKTSTFKNDVATAAASTPSSSSASSAVVASSDHPAPPAGSGSGSTAVASIDPVIAKQDPVYLAWRAQELLSSPSKRQFSIDELLAMEDREAFDAMYVCCDRPQQAGYYLCVSIVRVVLTCALCFCASSLVSGSVFDATLSALCPALCSSLYARPSTVPPPPPILPPPPPPSPTLTVRSCARCWPTRSSAETPAIARTCSGCCSDAYMEDPPQLKRVA